MALLVGTAGAHALAWAKFKAKLFESSGFNTGLLSSLDAGEALDEATRTQMESFFGYDLRDVRIHETEQAGELARKLQAEAFTIGNNIFAAAGKLNNVTGKSKGLLAHEVTHVIQQTHPQPTIPIFDNPESDGSYTTELPISSVTSRCTEMVSAPTPQLATSSPSTNTTSQATEAEAETVEQTIRSTTENSSENQTKTPHVDPEELADLVYQLMQQELLLEKDRIRR